MSFRNKVIAFVILLFGVLPITLSKIYQKLYPEQYAKKMEIAALALSAKTDERKKTSERIAAGIAAEEAACKKELLCWAEKYSISAGVYCEDYVEKLAQYSHGWTDGMLEPKFSQYRWKNINKGVVTYIGDKIKFQNGFGAWKNYVYECDYDPINEVILDVRAQAGRL